MKVCSKQLCLHAGCTRVDFKKAQKKRSKIAFWSSNAFYRFSFTRSLVENSTLRSLTPLQWFGKSKKKTLFLFAKITFCRMFFSTPEFFYVLGLYTGKKGKIIFFKKNSRFFSRKFNFSGFFDVLDFRFYDFWKIFLIFFLQNLSFPFRFFSRFFGVLIL